MERLPFAQAPFQIRRRAHDQVHRERRRHRQSNADRLIMLVARRHNNQDIDIAIRVRRAISIRTKQNDLVRSKLRSDPAREAADHLERYIRPTVASLRQLLWF